MTEEQQSADTSDGGLLLKRTRESLGLSVEDIAEELHLSPRHIEALESDDWDQLPGITYARGYLRAYARLIGLDAEQLLAEAITEEIEVSPVEPEIEAEEKEHHRESETEQNNEAETPAAVSRPRWGIVAGGVIFVVALLAVWQYQGVFWESQTAIESEHQNLELKRAQEDEAEIAAAVDAMDAETLQEAEVGNPNPGSQVAEDVPIAVTDQPPTPTEPQRIVFQFDQRSWIDVRDAAGDRLLYRDFQPGRRIEVEGKPPFRIFLGNARGVQVEYLGGIIKPDTTSSRLYARFELAPPG